MYVKIRKLDSTETRDVFVNLSKKTPIEELRKLVYDKFQVDVDKQKLIYKGKLLEDDHCIIDYNIQLNDVIQLMVQIDLPEDSTKDTRIKDDREENREEQTKVRQKSSSDYYKIGDDIDVIDVIYGGWFEGTIIDIFIDPDHDDDKPKATKESHLTFKVKMDSKESYSGDEIDADFDHIRPRAFHTFKKSELQVGETYMVNYNLEKPQTRGYWYDCTISHINRKNIKGIIYIGRSRVQKKISSLKFIDEVMRIEEPKLISELPERSNKKDISLLRKNIYYCERCKDDDEKNCKDCGCKVCTGKNDLDKLLLCDECNGGYHIFCLTPPLEEVPEEDEWYCPACKTDQNEIVKPGDKLKSKKSKTTTSKDWGKGMACVGRTTKCTIVPKKHFGPIPGIEVGTCWKFRLQVSEAGLHRPHVAGIHGRQNHGAYSLVLSGGYEDDIDYGEEFLYTGSGGRDLSGNKRVSEQSSDQSLTKMNKALALNCNVKVNPKGAKATDWKAGKPVRVVRNYKLGPHSKYAPAEGNRYDGIYKVVEYYPETGKAGFLVWRFLLRRDDPSPPPWSDEGHEGEVIYPPGYLEAQATKEQEVEAEKKRNSKRKISASPKTTVKKRKLAPYQLDKKIEELIEADTENEKLWDECARVIQEGKNVFLAKIEEIFMCICCQEIVYLPITTPCKHNICKGCLKRSFASEIYTCPCCRFELGKNFKLNVNTGLSKVISELFPGYEATRK